MKKVTDGIEYFAVRLLTAYSGSLSEHGALRFGASLGGFARRLLRSRVKVVLENIRLCGVSFGSRRKLKLFVTRCFQHIGVTAIEILRQKSYRDSDFEKKIVCEDKKYLEEAYRLKRGAVLMSGHFGNWELMGTYIRHLGYPVDLLVKRQSNRRLDEFINSFRTAQGVGIIYTDIGMRALVEAVRKGRFVAILADQYGGAESEPAKLFGKDILVPTGPAALIQKYNSTLIFGASRRAKNGRHKLTIEMINKWDGYSRSQIVQKYTELLENAIRISPEMWLWTHRKFKNLTDYCGTVK